MSDKELAKQNCIGCKHCAKARRLIDGKWNHFHICTLFLEEAEEALYLPEPERDLCECFEAKGGTE